MAFTWVYNDFGAPIRRIGHLLAKDNEEFVRGEAVKIDADRITKAAPGDAILGFVLQNLKAGVNQKIEVSRDREGDWYDVEYTGTPSAGFVIGVGTANLSTDGLSINAANVTGGAFAVEEINTNTKTARVTLQKRMF